MTLYRIGPTIVLAGAVIGLALLLFVNTVLGAVVIALPLVFVRVLGQRLNRLNERWERDV